jgi:hypothetical protein
MNRSQNTDQMLSEIASALRRIWSALKERIVPSQPAPVPVTVRSDRRR